MLLLLSITVSILLPSTIPLYGASTMYVPIHLLMDISVVFHLGLLQIKLP